VTSSKGGGEDAEHDSRTRLKKRSEKQKTKFDCVEVFRKCEKSSEVQHSCLRPYGRDRHANGKGGNRAYNRTKQSHDAVNEMESSNRQGREVDSNP